MMDYDNAVYYNSSLLPIPFSILDNKDLHSVENEFKYLYLS